MINRHLNRMTKILDDITLIELLRLKELYDYVIHTEDTTPGVYQIVILQIGRFFTLDRVRLQTRFGLPAERSRVGTLNVFCLITQIDNDLAAL